MLRRTDMLPLLTLALSALAVTNAEADSRTFVASTGVDTNPCSLFLPCRTFNAAIAQTPPGGDVVILDTAGYGPAVINKSIKIIAPTGVYGGVSVTTPGTDGITINAADNDIVTLRGLDVTGVGGLYGINVLNANRVYIQATTVSGFRTGGGACVNMNTPRDMVLVILDSFLHDCPNGLLFSSEQAANRPVVEVENTRFVHTLTGLSLSGHYAVNMHKSTVALTGVGVLTSDTIDNTLSRLNIDDSLFTTNDSAIMTTGSGTAAPIFAISNSRFHQNFTVVHHGFGAVSIDRIAAITGANSFVNCGSGAVTSAGNNTINMIDDMTLPAGCSSFITSFSTILPK